MYDIGAHVGYYTVLASGLVGESGQVVCFEPVPANLYYLHSHLQMNECANVKVIEACVGERSRVCHFERRGSGSGHISENGDLTVQVVSLDELINEGAIPEPDCMKIDVEGAEYSVLQGAQSLLARTHPTIFLSLHSDQMRQQCFELLRARGYQLGPIKDEPLAEASEIVATAEN